MTSVREASIELLRARGITTIFGNPGSTELPMLGPLPEGFRYILALHEGVATAMADGFAQASGSVAHVNLHTAPGLGNAIGAIATARANRAPLLVTAGQQARSLITMEALLTNRRATEVPLPYVKWAFEPPRAADVPFALARAIHHAELAPRGPAFVSIPLDDWAGEVGELDYATQLARNVSSAAAPSPREIARLAERLRAARRPALVAGPQIDASGGWEDAVRLAEEQRMAVWATPATGGSRIGFPEDHPAFQGALPPAVGPLTQVLEGHDLVLVAGSQVFPYYPDIPGPFLPSGCELVAITDDPDEAARAPMGDALVADVALALRALVQELAGEPSGREPPPPRVEMEIPAELRPEGAEGGAELGAGEVHGALAEVFPEDGIIVLESPSSTAALRNRVRISRPGSYYFSASGGLGFGLPAALGVALAQPQRPVVCVLGEGSAQYAITGFWTAAAYSIPVRFLVLRNSEYSILKWFAALEGVAGAPALDLPRLDVAATAESYGVPSSTLAGGEEELREALAELLAADGPCLLQVDVAPGMALT